MGNSWPFTIRASAAGFVEKSLRSEVTNLWGGQYAIHTWATSGLCKLWYIWRHNDDESRKKWENFSTSQRLARILTASLEFVTQWASLLLMSGNCGKNFFEGHPSLTGANMWLTCCARSTTCGSHTLIFEWEVGFTEKQWVSRSEISDRIRRENLPIAFELRRPFWSFFKSEFRVPGPKYQVSEFRWKGWG